MAEIKVEFNFSRGDETRSFSEEFEVDSGLIFTIDTRAEELVEELNEELADELDCIVLPIGAEAWDFDGYEVLEWDSDYADPADFDDLDAYGEYVEACEEHGEGYKLRYEDIGEFNFNDQYNGCWASEAEFAQSLHEDLYGSDNPLYMYVDWDHYARDVMMDYSSYDGSDGYHIFRD